MVESQGADLVELQYGMPKRGRGVLRLFVDRTGGISIEELARINRMVGGLLEVHDIIPGAYTLEVSSPGLTRALKTPKDYQRYVGRLVRVTTRAPWEGRQVPGGILQGLEDDRVSLRRGRERTVSLLVKSPGPGWIYPEKKEQGGLAPLMNLELKRIIDQVSRDKGIDKDLLVGAIKDAIRSAAKKKHGPRLEIEVEYRDETGEIEVFQYKE